MAMNGIDVAASPGEIAGAGPRVSWDFEAATGSIAAAPILYWEKLQAWKGALAESTAFQTYHGPFSLGANASNGGNYVVTVRGSGTIDSLLVNPAGEITGTAASTGSETTTVQGALDGTSTFEDSLTGSEEVSGTLRDFVIGELPYPVPILDFRYTFTTSSTSNVLQIDATGTFVGLDAGPGLLLNGDVFFHATLASAGTAAGGTVFHGQAGNNAFTGGSGVDTVDYSASPSAVTADLQSGTALNGYGGTDTLSSIENLNGSAFDDILRGTDGNNVFVGGAGNDQVIGRLGLDTMQFASARAINLITRVGNTIVVGGPEGADLMTGIERLQFSDRSIAFDLGPGEAAGNTVRIIGAAFGAARLTPDIVGAGIDVFDTGATMLQVADLALSTSLYVSLAGSRSNVDFVNTVYRNVVGVLPSPQERDFYVGLLQGSGGTMSQADLLVLAANSAQNEVNINLVGMQQTGIDFLA